jgi:hypothetical protein
MRRDLLSTVLSVSVLFSTLVAAQDVSYTFTIIDMPGATLLTEAYGINAAGQIVGVFDDSPNHGFVATPARRPQK